MKNKVLFSFLIVMVALLCSAVAENADVQLIAGLKFGMDYDEALRVSGYSSVTMKDYDLKDRSKFGITNSNSLRGSGTIGGYDATVNAYFDSDNKLVQVVYGLKSTEDYSFDDFNERPDVNKKAFDSIEETLNSVYGSELTTRNFPVSIPHGFRQVDASILVFNYQDYDYTARIIGQSDGSSVLIEHQRDWCFHYSGQFHEHYVAYTHFDTDLSADSQTNNSTGF